jgi:outer membrane protein assembly factor BamB
MFCHHSGAIVLMPRFLILGVSCFLGCFFAAVSGADVPGGTAGLSSSTPASTGARASSAIRGDWPQWRGPNRDGISTDRGLLRDWTAHLPKLLWTAEGMGSGFASVAVSGGRVYTTGGAADGEIVTCVHADDGRVLWKQPLSNTNPRNGGYPGCRCTPTIDGDRLYAIASSGKIACLKTADGSEVWSKDFKTEWGGRMMSGWGFSESPLVDGDWVLCTPGSADAMIVALDKLTGKEVWRSKVPSGGGPKDGAGYSSIVVSNACGVKQYVQLVGQGVIGVRAKDGEFLWAYNEVANRTANIPTPLISGDYVFASTGYGAGAALLKLVKEGDGIKCDEQYFLPGEQAQNHHGQMVLNDGYVYFGHKHGQGFPICIELATGKIVWGGSQRGPGNGSAAICYADGNLVFRYQSGEVALIEASPAGYHLKGSFKPDYVGKDPCWAQPVITGGCMYLRDQDKLMCYDVRAK